MLVSRLAQDDIGAASEVARATSSAVDFEAELARSWARLWVARPAADAPLSAFLVVWVVADELHLIHVATHPGFQRRGAGRALMRTLLESAPEHKSRLILLEVRKTNRPAVRLYRSFGFSAMGVRRGYYADGEDAIEMMLTLDPETGAVRPGRDEVELAEA
jgi:ribosomal-protein-alanine N-acetyltransferase